MLCRLCFAIIVLCLASPRVVTHTRSHVDGVYTGAHARDQRPGPRSRVGARIERLKLIRVYDRRIKPSIYRVSREDRQLMCRSRALRSAIVGICRVYFSIHTLRNRGRSRDDDYDNDDALSFRGRIRGDSAARKRTESRSFTSESFIIKRASLRYNQAR